MKLFFKQLFCWHDWQATHNNEHWFILERKCAKCNAEQVIVCC
ncbi:hypothetical protein [Bradyrhizobium sp. CCGB20]|nr:hypothetical protein [Bradyrhizobium sp. CCGB20]